MIEFRYGDCRLSKQAILKTASRLKPELKRLKAADFEDERGSINLPTMDIKHIKKLIVEKKKLNPSVIVVIGIGGSNLGTVAVQEAVLGQDYDLNNSPKILYADTVDADKINAYLSIVEAELKKNRNVLLNVISKSGTTTETIANFEVFLKLVEKYKRKYQEFVVVTTDEGSKLWKYARDHSYSHLAVPKKVGGRYSVFSAVGLFPLGMLGIDLKKLLKGAAEMTNKCMGLRQNPAAIGASIIYLHKKRNIYDNFIYSTDMKSYGKWYRQLMGESIGKEWNAKHTKRVNAGITPTVSIGTTDLHSMAQLYLGGPQDKLTNFVWPKQKQNVRVPADKEVDDLVEHIRGKTYSTITTAIREGVKIAYRKSKRPFTETILERKDEKSVGALLQLKMIEMMFLGYLLNVNPFDQPSVEKYKKETRQLMKKSS